ncbi:MAG: type II pantothenate kinase [Elusimicrobiaceae bacterium]|nr:type II pantothenate kinase [Elusimicrobiaceae bacterium]
MNVIIGIDVGGSTTKIVGYSDDGKLIGRLQVEAADPLTSAYGALGKFVNEKNLSLSQVKQIVLTGVGASLFKNEIYGIPARHVDEFQAIGLGGLALSKKKEAIIVSMGTGTAFVRADKDGIRHIGGSGVGGGTVIGLCGQLCNARSFDTVVEMASQGDLNKVDLNIADISSGEISTLSPDVTASNFGKMADGFSSEDLARGVLNMVFQTIGMLAVFACKNDNIKDVVLTGTLSTVPCAKTLFKQVERLYNIKFIIPTHSIYATATGAALSYIYRNGKKK